MEGGLIAYLESMNSPHVTGLSSGNPLCLHDILAEMETGILGDSSIDSLVSVAIDLGILPNDTSETLNTIKKWKLFVDEDDLVVLEEIIEIFESTQGEINNKDFFKIIMASSDGSDNLSTAVNILCSILISITADEIPGGIDQTEEELNAQLSSLFAMM